MPTTKEEICTNSCLLLGAGVVNSFTDGTVESQVSGAFYERSLKTLLSERRWSFASKQGQCSQLVSPPDVDWAYAYQFPSGLIKLWEVIPDYIEYELFGTKKIFTNYDGELWVDFSFRPAESEFPDWFTSLFEYELAKKFCIPLTDNEEKLKAIEAARRDTELKAKRADSQQRKGVGLNASLLTRVRG